MGCGELMAERMGVEGEDRGRELNGGALWWKSGNGAGSLHNKLVQFVNIKFHAYCCLYITLGVHPHTALHHDPAHIALRSALTTAFMAAFVHGNGGTPGHRISYCIVRRHAAPDKLGRVLNAA